MVFYAYDVDDVGVLLSVVKKLSINSFFRLCLLFGSTTVCYLLIRALLVVLVVIVVP